MQSRKSRIKANETISYGCTYAADSADKKIIFTFSEETQLCTDLPKVPGESCEWGKILDDDGVCKLCSDIIANCTLCATANQCLKCDDTNLQVSSFKTKLQKDYLYCTNQLNLKPPKPDGTLDDDSKCKADDGKSCQYC